LWPAWPRNASSDEEMTTTTVKKDRDRWRRSREQYIQSILLLVMISASVLTSEQRKGDDGLDIDNFQPEDAWLALINIH
jgi:hypothetical protein